MYDGPITRFYLYSISLRPLWFGPNFAPVYGGLLTVGLRTNSIKTFGFESFYFSCLSRYFDSIAAEMKRHNFQRRCKIIVPAAKR